MMVVQSLFGNWKATNLSSFGGSGRAAGSRPRLFLQQEVSPWPAATFSSFPGQPMCPTGFSAPCIVPWRTTGPPTFPALAAPVLEDLKKVFKTDFGPGVHLSRQRHRRLGGLAVEHALSGRQGARRAVRHVQPSLDRHGPAARASGRYARCRVGRGRAGRAVSGGAGGGQGARDQGRALHPQRDRHRRHQRRRRRCGGRSTTPGIPRCSWWTA